MMNAERGAEVLSRKERIEQLKARAEELSKGEMTSFVSDHCPEEVQEEFWRRVVECAEAPLTSHAKALEKTGLRLPPADQLNDEQLRTKLWLLIMRLADMHCFLSHTDHLSDRELYAHLVEETLQEEVEEELVRPSPGSSFHYDMIGGGSDEDIQVMLRYYSDEAEREQWHYDFPDDQIPPMRTPPYDRDRLLPKWDDR